MDNAPFDWHSQPFVSFKDYYLSMKLRVSRAFSAKGSLSGSERTNSLSLFSALAAKRRKFLVPALAISCSLLLSACGPVPGDTRPDNQTMIAGINLLLNSFQAKYPKLVNWNSEAVRAQLKGQIPIGEDTDAGWLLRWPNASSGELTQVIVPWTLLGQYPNNPKPIGYRYSGGELLPQSTTDDITNEITTIQLHGDQYFAAIVDVRASKVNPQWVIFTTVPYLPITDPAYGFVTVANKHWSVGDFGTANVGCGKVPAGVESEFGFTC